MVGRVPPPLLERPSIRRRNLRGKSEGPSSYVKGLQSFLSSTTLSFKSNYTAELLQRFRSRQVDVELYGQGCKTLRRNRAGTRPVRGCRREVAAGDDFPAVFRLTQACGGSTLRGPSGGIPPSTTGRQFVGEQRRGKMDTQWSPKPQSEHSIEASGLILLECSGCGGELLLLG